MTLREHSQSEKKELSAYRQALSSFFPVIHGFFYAFFLMMLHLTTLRYEQFRNPIGNRIKEQHVHGHKNTQILIKRNKVKAHQQSAVQSRKHGSRRYFSISRETSQCNKKHAEYPSYFKRHNSSDNGGHDTIFHVATFPLAFWKLTSVKIQGFDVDSMSQ